MQLPGRLLLSNAQTAPRPVPLLVWSFAMQIAGLLTLIVHGTIAMWAGVLLFAAGAGLTTLARPFLVLDRYGAERSGYANGVIARGQQLARAAGPIVAAALAESTGYGVVFAVLAAILVIAALMAKSRP